ncbi:DUF2206 domain-containing protein [Methanobacterium alkalithermotolerans]|uniref:DUF2206 domain-containing protein n=1 Tax=Methanobacterium alkalithermotolerans TaxID=2731220 RepID=A0A8T8K661_9EURY|nr:DUF2206 domain-containing protein [Methanobacterium alkalithermotolerans]QUH22623.1 DUF2206 domain-containing protein [Methanobacterium alkalithermotolerans]
MKALNPFQMNDWPIKRFLIFIFSIQISVWGLIGLDIINITIPILRELVCFIYLTFIPGFLILRILKLHDLGIESILFAIGLSLSTTMIMGFLINTFYPIFGIRLPITLLNLITTLSILVLFLSILSYLRDRKYENFKYMDLKELINSKTLLLSIMPFLAIFGTFIFNLTGINTVQMITLIVIFLLPIVIIKFLPENYYYLTTFIVSITILYYTSLVSFYLWGADINTEYNFSRLVLANFFWDLSIPNNVNGMLSVAFLPSIYSLILKMDISWVFKIIYPFFFSLVPLGLFEIYQKQTNKKIAFLAVFFFISMFVYYTVMPAVPRQQIAELFLMLFLLALFSTKVSKMKSTLFMIIFGFSIIVSHYGLSYIMILVLILGFFLGLVIPKIKKFNNLAKIEIVKNKSKTFFIKNYGLIILFIVFSITWFLYVSSSTIFNVGVTYANNIISSSTELFSKSQAANIVTRDMEIFNSIERYLHIISQFFIVIGVLSLLKNKNYNFKPEFKIFCISSLIITISGIILPFFSNAMNSDRLYHITLLFLAPLFVIGMKNLIKFLNDFFKRVTNKKIKINYYHYISIFLMIFFLFSSSFIYQIFDQPKLGRFALDEEIDFPKVNELEIKANYWLNQTRNQSIESYADVNKMGILNSQTFLDGNQKHGIIERDTINSNKSSYLFISGYTINTNKILILRRDAGMNINNVAEYVQLTEFDNKTSKIFDNGGSWILKK